jgi:hypothetical protein
LDVIEWADMAAAKAAADQIMTAEPVAGFMALIDGPSVVMRHAGVLATWRCIPGLLRLKKPPAMKLASDSASPLAASNERSQDIGKNSRGVGGFLGSRP